VGIANPKVRIASSHETLVWAYDPDVIDPHYAGWIPRRSCGGIREGVDLVVVRGLGKDELATYIGLLGEPHKANLYVVEVAIVSVNGDSKAISEWLDRVYISDPRIVRMLAEWVLLYSRGESPVELLDPEAREVYGSRTTFRDPAAAVETQPGVG